MISLSVTVVVAFINTCLPATAAQPSVIEVVGATEEESPRPALGGEIDNILQAINKFAQVKITSPTDAECDWVVYVDSPKMCRIRARKPKSKPPN